MDQRDLSIISQNAGSTAAALINAADNQGKTPLDLLDEFVSIRDAVFNGTLDAAGTNRQAVIETIEADAAARAAASFNRPAATQTAAPSSGGGGGSSVGRIKVIKQQTKNGEPVPLPEWLESQVDWLVGKGDIPDTSEIELWDNRQFVEERGGKGAPFATKWKPAGSKYGVSVWPPKKGG